MKKEHIKTISKIISTLLVIFYMFNLQANNIELSKTLNKNEASDNTYLKIQQLTNAIQSNPENLRIRLDLATAYYEILEYDSAQAELEKVLADSNIPEKVRMNVNKFLARIKQQQDQSYQQNSNFEARFKIFYGHEEAFDILTNFFIIFKS